MISGDCSEDNFIETLAEKTISAKTLSEKRISDDKQQYRLKRLEFKRRMMKLVGFFFQHISLVRKTIHCLHSLLIRINTVINDVNIVISDMNLLFKNNRNLKN